MAIRIISDDDDEEIYDDDEIKHNTITVLSKSDRPAGFIKMLIEPIKIKIKFTLRDYDEAKRYLRSRQIK